MRQCWLLPSRLLKTPSLAHALHPQLLLMWLLLVQLVQEAQRQEPQGLCLAVAMSRLDAHHLPHAHCLKEQGQEQEDEKEA